MLSALNDLTDRLDHKFLIAYWLPAFVAVAAGIGLLAGVAGPQELVAWLDTLDAVEQTLGVLVVVLLITMGALVLSALTLPIATVFAGVSWPRRIAARAIDRQRQARARALQDLLSRDPAHGRGAPRPVIAVLAQRFPRDPAHTQPTRFGNALAAAADYPRRTYAMEGAVWWPRLLPLLPDAVQGRLGAALAPVIGLLNLSVVCAMGGCGGALGLGLAGARWMTAILVLGGGLVLAALCYRAAVAAAMGLGTELAVAVDLYRHEILRQMGVEIPADRQGERTLWRDLTAEMLDQADPTITATPGSADPPHPAPNARTTHQPPAAATTDGSG